MYNILRRLPLSNPRNVSNAIAMRITCIELYKAYWQARIYLYRPLDCTYVWSELTQIPSVHWYITTRYVGHTAIKTVQTTGAVLQYKSTHTNPLLS